MRVEVISRIPLSKCSPIIHYPQAGSAKEGGVLHLCINLELRKQPFFDREQIHSLVETEGKK